jgi:hypothetical protein
MRQIFLPSMVHAGVKEVVTRSAEDRFRILSEPTAPRVSGWEVEGED